LFVTFGDTEKLKDKAVWFLRITAPDNKRKINLLLEGNDGEIIWGELSTNIVP